MTTHTHPQQNAWTRPLGAPAPPPPAKKKAAKPDPFHRPLADLLRDNAARNVGGR